MATQSVSASLIAAVQAQSELFEIILSQAPALAKKILDRDIGVRPNYWGTWHSRSVLLTFDIQTTDKRARFHPYGWFIHYNQPGILVFASKAPTIGEWQTIHSLNLKNEHYFALEDTQKQNLIAEFLGKNMHYIQAHPMEFDQSADVHNT